MKAYRDFKKMQGIGATRIRLGLSQEIFAAELGISRSMLSRIENKQRNLPIAAFVKLAALEITVAGGITAGVLNRPAVSKHNETTEADSQRTLLYYKEMCSRAEAARKQCDLELMIASYTRLKESIAQVDVLIREEVNGGERFPPGFLKTHRYHLQCKLDKSNLHSQARLRHKIALLYAAAELHALSARVKE